MATITQPGTGASSKPNEQQHQHHQHMQGKLSKSHFTPFFFLRYWSSPAFANYKETSHATREKCFHFFHVFFQLFVAKQQQQMLCFWKISTHTSCKYLLNAFTAISLQQFHFICRLQAAVAWKFLEHNRGNYQNVHMVITIFEISFNFVLFLSFFFFFGFRIFWFEELCSTAFKNETLQFRHRKTMNLTESLKAQLTIRCCCCYFSIGWSSFFFLLFFSMRV